LVYFKSELLRIFILKRLINKYVIFSF